MTDYDKPLGAATTTIPGLTVWDLTVHGDNRGWFKENWQREKMLSRGLPDFGPVQNNISYNHAAGTTRGFHAEPWDKFISVATGRIFGAWVDLREGPNFGVTFTTELDVSKAVFVPRGVGNAYQTLEPSTAYTYLVNSHYLGGTTYTSVNLADDALGISWPIPLEQAEISAKDRKHPGLNATKPLARKKILVVGSSGQVGRALRREFAESSHLEFSERSDLNLTSPELESERNWCEYEAIINAAAFTAVDEAETPHGRAEAWATNVTAVANLSKIAARNDIVLTHISSDYVFDGTQNRPYREDDPLCPLSVYGQTKAAGDQVVANVPRHYIVRTSWVVGDGQNFVRTMASLAATGVDPKVVNDQLGRLTFAPVLAEAIRHLIDTDAPYGTYNVTCSGPVVSWADIARRVFQLCGHSSARVTGVSSDEYASLHKSSGANRPKYSVLDITKIASYGYCPPDAETALSNYLASG